MNYLSVSEAAADLGITEASVYRLIDHLIPTKRLDPVNRGTYRGDGGYRFRASDVERIKKEYYTKPDLTAADVARELNRSVSFVYKIFRERTLPYYEAQYKGKKTFFTTRTDLQELIQQHPDLVNNDIIYDSNSGHYLYQLWQKDDRTARLVKLKRLQGKNIEAYFDTSDGEHLKQTDIYLQKWEPVQPLMKKRKQITSYGYAKFEFPKPASVDSTIYQTIETIFQHVGPLNIQLSEGNATIKVEVKKVTLPIDSTSQFDVIENMKKFISEGEIIEKFDGVLIDPGLTSMTFYLSPEQKQLIQQHAEAKGITIHEWLESLKID